MDTLPFGIGLVSIVGGAGDVMVYFEVGSNSRE